MTDVSTTTQSYNAHRGDPCRYCGAPHDDVPPGPCQGFYVGYYYAEAYGTPERRMPASGCFTRSVADAEEKDLRRRGYIARVLTVTGNPA